MKEFNTSDKTNIPQKKNNCVLVWHDEFDGGSLSPEKWHMLRSMNCEGRIYDNSEKHIRVENGNLHMQIHRVGETYSLCEGVVTKNTMNFKYGYLEMRAKIHFRHCAWPSFWLLGNTVFHKEEIGWFAEIDIFEVFSSENKLSPNLHKWGTAGHEMLPGKENNEERAYIFQNTGALSDEYHIYGFEWNKNEMKFYVDGICYYTVPIDERSDFTSEIYPSLDGFHEPVYILLNNEMFTEKSKWLPEGYAATLKDPMPVDYWVDWIRLYQNPVTDTLILKDKIAEAAEK